MKTAKLVATIAMIAVMPAVTVPAGPAPADAPSSDVLTQIRAFMPQRSEDWESGGGVELQARFWSGGAFGTALCLGFDSWTVKSEYSESSDDESSMTTSIYGNMTLVPVGVSALYRNTISGKAAMVIEVGLRYVFTQSGINAEVVTEDADGSSNIRNTIEADNTFIGVIGANVETEIQDGMLFHIGFSYQFDLTEPRESFAGADMGVTSYNSPMVNIGVTWAF